MTACVLNPYYDSSYLCINHNQSVNTGSGTIQQKGYFLADGYELIINDDLDNENVFIGDTIYMIKTTILKDGKRVPLRKHQKDAVHSVITHLKTKSPRASISHCCRSGKSLTAVTLHKSLKSRASVVFLPNLNLVEQTIHDWTPNLQRTKVLVVCSDKSTSGEVVSSPKEVKELIKMQLKNHDSDYFSVHFHDTKALALSNIYVSLEEGIKKFDACIGGLGGCPFAPGATGNLATEDLVGMLYMMDIETGIDLDLLVKSRELASKLTALNLRGRML